MDLNQPIANFNQNLKPKGGQGLFKGPIFWVVVGALLAVAAALVYWLYAPMNESLPNENTKDIVKDTLPDGYQYQALAKDQYPEGFPEDLIIRGGAWQRSEIVQAAGGELKIVELAYKEVNPAALAVSFKKNIEKAGWKLTSEPVSVPIVVKIFKKASETLTVTTAKKGEGTLVNLTLAAR